MRRSAARGIGLAIIVGLGCGDDGGSSDADATGPVASSSSTAALGSTGDAESSTGSPPAGSTGTSADSTGTADASSSGSGSTSAAGETGGAPTLFTAVTFNTGGHADGQTDVADTWYGNGLSWTPAVDQVTQFFADLQPDIVVFQEIFHSPDCQDIPPEFHPGYVCETWVPGDPTVAQVVLGPGYQVACHLGKTDKCAAVKTSFGSFVGCDADYCIEGLDGAPVENCGGGSRVGRGVIELVGGGELTLVNFHGTSGFLPADQLCRVAQVDQVFLDLDGAPAANGARNLILGDLNTDPALAKLVDFSAQRWNDFVGDGHPFDFITDLGEGALPTYAGTLNIDHQISETFTGNCWHPGITPGYDPVVDFDYFDHVPAVCLLSMQ